MLYILQKVIESKVELTRVLRSIVINTYFWSLKAQDQKQIKIK